jgi:hypothetical protein
MNQYFLNENKLQAGILSTKQQLYVTDDGQEQYEINAVKSLLQNIMFIHTVFE